LKDKDAITRQWITIYKSALDKLGGERVFIDGLSRFTRVIKADWHRRPLQMTDHIQNRFYIRLRALQNIGLEDKKQSETTIKKLLTDGFPNFYGTQRFGINGKNWEE
jgi:tRNA pseudouridine13 synthase